MLRKLLAALLLCWAAPALAQQNNGATPYHLVAINSTNSNLIQLGQHTVFSIELGGVGSSPAFVKLYDKATAPTCGTDTPIKTLIIPVASTAANGAGSNLPFPIGIQVQNGLGICVTGGIADNDTTPVAVSSFVVNVDYR
jgi:hypothetical protein